MEAAAEAKDMKQGRSGELLSVGSSGGLYSKLLLNSKQNDKSGSCSPIVRIPRSSIFDRVQNFLPQMAQANENLSREMESTPDGTFDIENIEEEEKIIEMNVALVELSSSESNDEEEEESSSDGSSDSDGDVTEHNLKLRQKVKKGKIEVLDPSS